MDTFHSFLLPFLKQYSFKLCLEAFQETDVFKDLSRLFQNEGPIYDKANEVVLTFDRTKV